MSTAVRLHIRSVVLHEFGKFQHSHCLEGTTSFFSKYAYFRALHDAASFIRFTFNSNFVRPFGIPEESSIFKSTRSQSQNVTIQ